MVGRGQQPIYTEFVKFDKTHKIVQDNIRKMGAKNATCKIVEMDSYSGVALVACYNLTEEDAHRLAKRQSLRMRTHGTIYKTTKKEIEELRQMTSKRFHISPW